MNSIMILTHSLRFTKIAVLVFSMLFFASNVKGESLSTQSIIDIQKEVATLAGSQGTPLTQAELVLIMTRLAQLEKDLQTYVQEDRIKAAQQADSSAAKYLISTAGVLIFLVLVYFLADRLGIIDYIGDQIQARRLGDAVGSFFRDVRAALNR